MGNISIKKWNSKINLEKVILELLSTHMVYMYDYGHTCSSGFEMFYKKASTAFNMLFTNYFSFWTIQFGPLNSSVAPFQVLPKSV